MDWNRWKREKKSCSYCYDPPVCNESTAQQRIPYGYTREDANNGLFIFFFLRVCCGIGSVNYCERDAQLLAELHPEDAAVHAGGSADTDLIDVRQALVVGWCIKACSLNLGAPACIEAYSFRRKLAHHGVTKL